MLPFAVHYIEFLLKSFVGWLSVAKVWSAKTTMGN